MVVCHTFDCLSDELISELFLFKFSILLTDKNIQLPWLVDDGEFQRMMSHGEYLSYDNRLSLGRKFVTSKN